MNEKAIEKTELNKVLARVAEFAVLDKSKQALLILSPHANLADAQYSLDLTEEGLYLLFDRGVSGVEYFPIVNDEIARAKKGSTLACAELLIIAALLRSTRIVRNGIIAADETLTKKMHALADRLYDNLPLEEDITTKIIGENELSDYASDKLYSIRRQIRLLNEKIRSRLAGYLTGDESKFLQEGIVTMRDNRYVLPVRAEYKRNIKGFVHDRSASGATFFIEPEEVLEMNNELRALEIDEKQEVERILSELSSRVGQTADLLTQNESTLIEIDTIFARAHYAYKTSSIKPQINAQGKIDIKEGRHPLIDAKKVVPVSLKLGYDYRFLLVSGPNTGGKTVSLKMVGLFSLMSACGMFVPCKKATVAIFNEIYCDVGDAQSIEESLSTFSSHMTNIISIVDNADKDSLVLIDELGGGTDPDEGQALAKAIVSHLLKTGCTGVVTTHYTALKEFAFVADGIENACMEFDSNTLLPLYVMKIGMPGTSNALGISRRLGLRQSILDEATESLSKDVQKFENIVKSAEESRIRADEELRATQAVKAEWEERLREVELEKERLKKEKEKLFTTAKAESRKIIRERTAEAEELLSAIKEIFDKETLTENDLIRARTLKNKLADAAYLTDTDEEQLSYENADIKTLKVGQKVFVKTVAQEGVLQDVRVNKGEAEVLCGSIRIRVLIKDLALPVERKETPKEKIPKWKKRLTQEKSNVSVSKTLQPRPVFLHEINVIGQTVAEALVEVQAFIDSAVLSNLEEVRIVHGVGTGKLRAGIHEYLRKHKNVAEFRLGRYGEGETGVTIVKIK